jgi:hypothetical protein
MAKKKSESEKPTRTPPSKQTEAKKADPPKPTASSTPAGSSGIDTSLAANAAAAMVGNKAPLPAGAAPKKKESAAFKQLKAGLNKPSAGALGGAFGIVGQNKKTNQKLMGGKQTGHSQTFGADVNRAGVPRRTPG